MPSRDEGFGLVFLEAMRAGRPCIGGAARPREIIEDGVTGWLVAPATARSSRARRAVPARCPAADAMGARGRARFLQQFTEEHFRDRFSALVPLAAPALTA